MLNRSRLALSATLLLVACVSAETAPDPYATDVNQAAEAITAEHLLQNTQDLAADSMEGRAPGTPGEEMAVAYLQRQFQSMGLSGGNPDGSFIQNVDLIGYTSTPTVRITAGGRSIPMRFPDDYVASSRHENPETRVPASDIVFVGYGVVAPEYGWDDYKGLDVRGKTIVMLVNDPPVESGGMLDTAMFRGRAMTYYGRWTYKYEIASEKGAAAAIIVHETGPAGYGYEVVRGSFSREQFDVPSPGAANRVPVEGWMTLDKAKQIFAAAGANFDSLHAAARTREFQPATLNATADFTVRVASRRIQSKNVVAKIEGSSRADEYVIYTAHWDHLGRDETLPGDQINNGALDNASGTSQMLQIARAFKALPTAPARSVLFLAVTAEEKGLLGAKFYAQNPLYPLEKTAANLNMDGINQWGLTSDVTVIGLGNSTLDDVLTDVLAHESMTVRPDPEPEKGYYYRSDHFEFAKVGVPALYLDAGTEYIGKPPGYSQQKREEYIANDYHKPSDEVKPDWDLAGAVAEGRALFRVGYVIAQQAAFPEWKPGNEFKARRDSMMAAVAR